MKCWYIAQYHLPQIEPKCEELIVLPCQNHFVIYCIFRLLWAMKNIGTKSHVRAVISVNIQEVPRVSLNRKMNYLEVVSYDFLLPL